MNEQAAARPGSLGARTSQWSDDVVWWQVSVYPVRDKMSLGWAPSRKTKPHRDGALTWLASVDSAVGRLAVVVELDQRKAAGEIGNEGSPGVGE